MTSNSLRYAELQESERHNRAQEAHNRAVLDETKRHNLVTSQELASHNRATEYIQQQTHEESVRHNRRSENQNLLNIMEQTRSNIAKETETHRSNVSKEQETVRHNTRSEDITDEYNKTYLSELYRSNYARETETHRANVASEAIGRSNVSNAYMQAQASMMNASAAKQNALVRSHEYNLDAQKYEDIREFTIMDAAENSKQERYQTVQEMDKVGQYSHDRIMDYENLMAEYYEENVRKYGYDTQRATAYDKALYATAGQWLTPTMVGKAVK